MTKRKTSTSLVQPRPLLLAELAVVTGGEETTASTTHDLSKSVRDKWPSGR